MKENKSMGILFRCEHCFTIYQNKDRMKRHLEKHDFADVKYWTKFKGNMYKVIDRLNPY
jgi:hypothetical protein